MKTFIRRWLPKPIPTPAILLEAERFVLARFEPVAGAPARDQASLAIEAQSPFPPSQLLQGLVRSENGGEGLAYAAHRRTFGAEIVASWPADALVIPEFLALLGERPTQGGVVTHTNAHRILALAWKPGMQLPSGLSTLPIAEGTSAQVAAEAAAAAGLTEATPLIHEATGELTGQRTELGIELRCGSGPIHRLALAQVDDLDLRDPEFLDARQRAARWDQRLWRTAQVGVLLLLLAVVGELTALGFSVSANAMRTTVTAAEPRVRELQDLHALSAKVEELGRNRPLPFEMLAVANTHRPAGLVFTTVNQRTPHTLELEARTSSAADVGALEQALSADDLLAKVETRDIRGRDGVTTFALTLTFKPEALRKAAAGTP